MWRWRCHTKHESLFAGLPRQSYCCFSFLPKLGNTLAREEATTQFRTGPLCLASFRITKKMPSAADDIVEMITARTSHTGGTLDLSESLDNLGLDSMEVVSLIFDIEEKFNIQIPINANMDIESKTLADLIQAVDRLVADKVKSN